MTVIDVHTHMLTEEYLAWLGKHGPPRYERKPTAAGQDSIWMYGAPFMTLMPEMWDYDARIRNMDKAGVDLAIVSLTCPNAYFGDEAVSLRAARMVNDSMAEQQCAQPDRIAWIASLPWQYADAAVAELERATAAGAVGVMVIANIDGVKLTHPDFAPVWQAIDDRALPVLVHPTAPPGTPDMSLDEYGLVPPIGFMIDTTLAIARMILDGFLDRYPNLKIIASHGGGTLPYLAGRLDRCHEMIPACAEKISEKPSTYLERIWYDAVVYAENALELCLDVAGAGNVLYGSDYPHNIGDMAGCLSRVNTLAPDVAAQVRGGNARRIFGL
ncbi:MAG: amidohydrolase [Gammaproteobacteria bacterium]|nr:amidohydrolase [Gammaproteobacteria bacterium]